MSGPDAAPGSVFVKVMVELPGGPTLTLSDTVGVPAGVLPAGPALDLLAEITAQMISMVIEAGVPGGDV